MVTLADRQAALTRPVRPFAGLGTYATDVPHASTLPPGAVVVSLSGTERDDLTSAIIVYAVGVFAVGALAGWYLSR